jgi:2,4-dienoyl-CoA reductase (NADPH2)
MAVAAEWRAAECARRGVDVRLGVTATPEHVLALRPDAVIVATGGRTSMEGACKYHPMPIPGSAQGFVLDHEAALTAHRDLHGRVVILDAVGHIEGIGLGELVAHAGCETTLVTPFPTPIELDAETAALALRRAVRAGVRWRPTTVLAAIGDHQVTLVDGLSGTAETLTDVATVVIRTHGVPEDALYHALRDSGSEVLRVGDAVAVRPLDRAIFDGHAAGRAV